MVAGWPVRQTAGEFDLQSTLGKERRTSADIAFDYLQDEVLSLRLLPGTKISEAEIAAKLGLSRQPVREAFTRLDGTGLLFVQPQKATMVRKFSLERIALARFTRRAIELEVLHDAIRLWDGAMLPEFENNLAAQQTAFERNDIELFHKLDNEFHYLLCRAGGDVFAFETIQNAKAPIERLCVLSLTNPDEMADLIEDHRQLVDLISSGAGPEAAHALRVHLGRLDSTVQAIHEQHAHFFEDS